MRDTIHCSLFKSVRISNHLIQDHIDYNPDRVPFQLSTHQKYLTFGFLRISKNLR